jgi:hypothetical protein
MVWFCQLRIDGRPRFLPEGVPVGTERDRPGIGCVQFYAPFTRCTHISRRDSTNFGALEVGPKHEADVPMYPDVLLGGLAAAASFVFLIAVLWRPELF